MQKYKKPNTSKLDLIPNPLSNTLKIHLSILTDSNSYRLDGGDLVNSIYKVEAEPYCRFYTSPEKRILINALSSESKELFLWIMYTIDSNKDYLWVNKERYMEELGIKSIKTYNKTIVELIRYGVVAQTVIKDTYWINPEFFFKGNRVDKYPKSVVLN